MDYKAALEEQVRELQKVQGKIHGIGLVEECQLKIAIAEEIRLLVHELTNAGNESKMTELEKKMAVIESRVQVGIDKSSSQNKDTPLKKYYR